MKKPKRCHICQAGARKGIVKNLPIEKQKLKKALATLPFRLRLSAKIVFFLNE